ncbi:hypothetical protein C8Q78DRAFT_573576 [Trametes maxima]|nr:hypothetical protein C8Q78DRAFT_573576 [Trametes maxima]
MRHLVQLRRRRSHNLLAHMLLVKLANITGQLSDVDTERRLSEHLVDLEPLKPRLCDCQYFSRVRIESIAHIRSNPGRLRMGITSDLPRMLPKTREGATRGRVNHYGSRRRRLWERLVVPGCTQTSRGKSQHNDCLR